MKKYIILFVMFTLISLVGCTNGGQGTEVQPLYLGQNKLINQSVADQAKQILISMEEVTEVKAVNFEQNIYAAVNVNHFQRLFLDQIRKNAHTKLKKRFPDTNVHVSTDKKVFVELNKLEEKLYQNKITKQNVKKELKRIEDFMKG